MVRGTLNRPLTAWSFTQIGGGQGTKDGEWLTTSEFPTTVHVELLRLKRIPDPVSVCAFGGAQSLMPARD